MFFIDSSHLYNYFLPVYLCGDCDILKFTSFIGVLFNDQGGYYSSLILQASELLPVEHVLTWSVLVIGEIASIRLTPRQVCQVDVYNQALPFLRFSS